MNPADIAQQSYLRERLNPQPGDPIYLHLSDLLLGLRQFPFAPTLRVLDYGCGGSPYRSLFAGSVYHRADFPGLPGLDFTFAEDSRLPAPDQSYDLILSTQVLEHVREPAIYLNECHRLLRPGGTLLLTTHGSFPDHACPHDYQRWTADGLNLAVTKSGLPVRRICKLTTSGRALLYFAQQYQETLLSGEFSWGGLCLRLLRLPFRWRRPAFDRFCDRQFADCRVVPAATPGHHFYVALLIEGVRPE